MTCPPLRIAEAMRADPQAFRTPCYVYDPQQAAANYGDLRALLSTRLVISIKANHNTDVTLRSMRPDIDGYELASAGELSLMPRTAGAPIFLNNPAMDAAFMRSGLAMGGTFIVDRPELLPTLAEFAAKRTPQPVLLRVNGAVLNELVPGSPAERMDHFGMDLVALDRAVDYLRDQGGPLKLGGLHCFAGSHSFERRRARHADFGARLFDRVASRMGQPFGLLNLGGGFSGQWREKVDELAAYARSLEPLRRLGLDLYHEAGRAIFEDSGVFATRVIGSKVLNGEQVVVCDGGIAQNFLLAQTERPLKRRACPALLRDTRSAELSPLSLRFVGPSCHRDDVIGTAAAGSPAPVPGDVLLFDRCGAYNETYTVRPFLALKEAQSYVVA